MMNQNPSVINIKKWALDNIKFRSEIYTNKHSKLTVMSLLPNQYIGMEKHNVDQLITVIQGTGTAYLNGTLIPLYEGAAISIPAGTTHNITNTGFVDMKLYSVYSSSNLQGV